MGSLGSGNHFLEVQAIEEVYDPVTAQRFGLAHSQVCVMIHCGSRGLGHQICGDHVRIMDKAMPRYGITVPDRQLACAPIGSPEGRGYLAAMAAAANYGRANRHVLADTAREIFARAAGASLTWCTTYPTTWRKWKPTRWTGSRRCCACTARALPAVGRLG